VSTNRRPIIVLLVDDQPFVGVAIKRLLASEADIEVHCCHVAEEAVAVAAGVGPTLILQDLVMPGIDGLTLVASYRSTATTAATAIIVLSGSDDPTSRDRALAAGANDFLLKLPAKADLVACIRRHSTGVGQASPKAETTTLASVELECRLDPIVIGDLIQASSDFTSDLVDLFLEDARGRIEALRQSTPSLDHAEMRRAAHSLKGSALTMGAKRLAALSHRLEEHAKASGDAEGAAEMTTAIDAELAEVATAFAEAKLGSAQPGTRGAA
jgi:DNA-binding response OmpR family regulator